MKSIENKNSDIFNYLINFFNNCEIKYCTDFSGNTTFFKACDGTNIEIIKNLTKYSNIQQKNYLRRNGFMKACLTCENIEIIKFLVSLYDVNEKDIVNDMLLSWLAQITIMKMC